MALPSSAVFSDVESTSEKGSLLVALSCRVISIGWKQLGPLFPRDRMERKLLTKRGRAQYKKRGVLVEPVFGQVKEGQGFRRFMRRGLATAPCN